MRNSSRSCCLKERLKVLKIEFREFCVRLSLKQIKSVFSSAGFNLAEEIPPHETRRELVDAFYQSADWNKEETVKVLFKVIEYTLQLYYLEEEEKNIFEVYVKKTVSISKTIES